MKFEVLVMTMQDAMPACKWRLTVEIYKKLTGVYNEVLVKAKSEIEVVVYLLDLNTEDSVYEV